MVTRHVERLQHQGQLPNLQWVEAEECQHLLSFLMQVIHELNNCIAGCVPGVSRDLLRWPASQPLDRVLLPCMAGNYNSRNPAMSTYIKEIHDVLATLN